MHIGWCVGTAAIGLTLAVQHPLWPVAMPALWVLWGLLVLCFPSSWLCALPMMLPMANFSPWSGWLVVEEFDLLVLATLWALHARRVLQHWHSSAMTENLPSHSGSRWMTYLQGVLWIIGILGTTMGLSRAPWSFDWFAAYDSALWSVRASKSLLLALLLWPWLRQACLDAPQATTHRIGTGMACGLGAVSLAILSERLAYPGLTEFTSHYRTTALFWEMHVGGAAIDTYLALSMPFAVWALWSARGAKQWTLACLLIVLATYACLTTFSRGVYIAVVISMCVMVAAIYRQRLAQQRPSRWLRWGYWLAGVTAASTTLLLAFEVHGYVGLLAWLGALLLLLLWLRHRAAHQGWRLPATLILLATVLVEVVAVTGGESFMKERIEGGSTDLDNRMAHWRHGLSLLQQPKEWLIGHGAGSFPAVYAASHADREFSGQLTWTTNSDGNNVMRLSGPQHMAHLGGLYAATQHISLKAAEHYRLGLRWRASLPTVLHLRVCERHLLYDRHCQSAVVNITAEEANGHWIDSIIHLRGPRLSAGTWYAHRSGVLSLAVLTAGTTIELDRVQLFSAQGNDLLENGDFSRQLAAWFPSAQRYYLPWHADNLLIELLVERGLLGLLAFAAFLSSSAGVLVRILPQGDSVAPTLLASIAGVLCVGLVSSVLDVPRVAFLVYFIALLGLALHSAHARNTDHVRPP